MAEPFNVDSSFACANTAYHKDGYKAYLLYSAGIIRRQVFKLGLADPLETPSPTLIPSLVDDLYTRLPKEQAVGHLVGKTIPKSQFIGMSIIRECSRPGHGKAGGAAGLTGPPDTPRSERLATFLFVADDAKVVDIAPFSYAKFRYVSGIGLSRGNLPGPKGKQIRNLIHFPISDEEIAAAVRIDQAIATLPASGSANDPFAVVHTLPPSDTRPEPVVIEQCIPGSVILDKAQP